MKIQYKFNLQILISLTNIFKMIQKKSQNINFQGVIASVSPVEYADFNEFLNKKTDKFRKIVILDGVEDPHNFGAILRTLAAASYDAVIIPKHRSCPVTPTVEKTSSGAVNYIPIIKTNSLSGVIDILKKKRLVDI